MELDEVVELSVEIGLDTGPMDGAVVDEVDLSDEIVPVTVPRNGEMVGDVEVVVEDKTDVMIEKEIEPGELVVASGCPKYVDVDIDSAFSNEVKSLKWANGANGFTADNDDALTEVIIVLDSSKVDDVSSVVGVGVPTMG